MALLAVFQCARRCRGTYRDRLQSTGHPTLNCTNLAPPPAAAEKTEATAGTRSAFYEPKYEPQNPRELS